MFHQTETRKIKKFEITTAHSIMKSDVNKKKYVYIYNQMRFFKGLHLILILSQVLNSDFLLIKKFS